MKLDRRFALVILAGLSMILMPAAALAGGLDYAQAGERALIKGDNQAAIQWFNKAIGSPDLSDKDRARTYYNRGLAYRRLGRLQMAVADYTQAIHRDPTNADALNNRAFVYIKLKLYHGAVRDSTRAIAINPNQANYHVNRALAFRQLGLYPQALTDINQAIRLNPGRAMSYYTRAIIYKRMGNKARYGADMVRFQQLRRLQSGQGAGGGSGK
jgi:tetratricopeptide (TPR) repeat protein